MTGEDIKKRLVDIETAKIHKCAEYLKSLGYFNGRTFDSVLREYGVAGAYFGQLYHLDYKFVWVKKSTMTFPAFIESIVNTVQSDGMFNEIKLYEEYQLKYRLNGTNVDYYEQEYMYSVAFMKKERLNLT